MLKAPFPWFGGKSKVAHLVWDRFGDVPNYVEPFAGSLAVLLGRPHAPKNETVNDKDAYLANFWWALKHDPEGVAIWADDPINETLLHARHKWLVREGLTLQQRMDADPMYYDPQIAGWWVWGISQWIGSGWCAHPEWTGRTNAGRVTRGIHTDNRRPHLQRGGQGVTSNELIEPSEQLPHLGDTWRGVNRPELQNPSEQLPALSTSMGINRKIPYLGKGEGVHRKMPGIGGTIAGVHRDELTETVEKRPVLHKGGLGVHRAASAEWRARPQMEGNGIIDQEGGRSRLYDYFDALAARLRRVRVCCGEWDRILGPSPTTKIGLTGVFLDPPYDMRVVQDKPGSDGNAPTDVLYNQHDNELSRKVSAWAIEHGDDPMLRIAVCGYEGEHTFPPSWECIAWKANGGYGNQADEGTPGRKNAGRERIWFSPHCIRPTLFSFDHEAQMIY